MEALSRAAEALCIFGVCVYMVPAWLAASLALAPALDPQALLSNKAAQPTYLRPYREPSENGGLETATLAMG